MAKVYNIFDFIKIQELYTYCISGEEFSTLGTLFSTTFIAARNLYVSRSKPFSLKCNSSSVSFETTLGVESATEVLLLIQYQIIA